MPQPFLGFLPSESSPHRRSLTSLKAAWLPCSYPPACWGAQLDPFAAGFPDSRRFHASCLVPPPTMGFLFTRRSTLPGLPGVRACETAPFCQLHLLRSFTPSCESVRSCFGFPLTSWPILSWASAPLELSSSTPRILDPPRLESLSTCPSGSRLKGPQPLVPGEVVPTPRVAMNQPRRRIPVSLRDRPAPPLDGVSFSLGLRTSGAPAAHDLQSF